MVSIKKEPTQLDQYICEKLNLLRSNYKQTGDAGTVLLAAEALVSKFHGVPGSLSSYHLGKLLTFVSDLKLSRASTISELYVVQRTAERTIEILRSSVGNQGNLIQAISSASLYLAVALKAQRKYDESFRILRQAKLELRQYYDTNYLDEILLTRQETLQRQSQIDFINLLDNVPQYINSSPHEAYASLKRVLEYCLNHGHMRLARDILPLFMETYRLAAEKLSLLSKISFQKNMGHFFILDGQKKKANKILNNALFYARSLGYKGQAMQIEMLISEIECGNHAFLIPFVI